MSLKVFVEVLFFPKTPQDIQNYLIWGVIILKSGWQTLTDRSRNSFLSVFFNVISSNVATCGSTNVGWHTTLFQTQNLLRLARKLDTKHSCFPEDESWWLWWYWWLFFWHQIILIFMLLLERLQKRETTDASMKTGNTCKDVDRGCSWGWIRPDWSNKPPVTAPTCQSNRHAPNPA